ncbi:MAG TPA: hypothetical protein VGM32_02555 [Rhodopila sp.]|jgi:hypothetical protein
MSTQIADAAPSPPTSPASGPCTAADHPASAVVQHDVHGPAFLEQPLAVTRGIVFAIMLSVPFWALLAFTLYLLI